MANNTFTFVGTLGINKKTEKFNPYTEGTSKGGWVSRKLNFNVKNKLNFGNCEIYGGYSKKTPIIYSFTKQDGDKKGQAVQIPFNERKEDKWLDKVAEFKKFVIVLGKDTRMTFLSEYDFAENVKTIIDMEQYKNATFKVVGNIVHNEYNGKFYTKYQPTRIYLVENEEDKAPISEGVLEFHYGQGAIVDNFEDAKKIFINGYTRAYDSNRKKEIGIPVSNLEIDFSGAKEGMAEKVYNKYTEIFTNNEENFNKIGLKIKILKGTEEVEFDESMLDDEQKELIEMGLLDIEDVKKEMGSGKSNRIEAIKIIGLAKGYSKGAIDAGFMLEDYLIPEAEVFNDEPMVTGEKNDDEDLDLDLDLDL